MADQCNRAICLNVGNLGMKDSDRDRPTVRTRGEKKASDTSQITLASLPCADWRPVDEELCIQNFLAKLQLFSQQLLVLSAQSQVASEPNYSGISRAGVYPVLCTEGKIFFISLQVTVTPDVDRVALTKNSSSDMCMKSYFQQ